MKLNPGKYLAPRSPGSSLQVAKIRSGTDKKLHNKQENRLLGVFQFEFASSRLTSGHDRKTKPRDSYINKIAVKVR